MIPNGNTKENKNRGYTFTGVIRCMVINYIIGDKETKEWAKQIKVEYTIDLEHQPVKEMIKGRKRKTEKQRGKEKFWKGIWDKERRK